MTLMVPPFAKLVGTQGAAYCSVAAPTFDPSVYGLDALTDKYGVYSTARVLTTYDPSGNLIRLRRSTDDEEADFGAVASTGMLDTSAITTWLGGGTGYCTTLYDQSGNGRNAIQATAASQPSLDLSGSVPCLDFDGSNDSLNAAPSAAAVFRNVGQGSMLAICKYETNAVTDTVMGVSTNVGAARLVMQKTSAVFRGSGRRLDADSSQTTIGIAGSLGWVMQLVAADWANSNIYHRIDSTEESSTSFQTDGNTSDTDSPYVFLGAQPVTNWMDGKGTLWVLTRDLLSGSAGGNLASSLAGLKVT